MNHRLSWELTKYALSADQCFPRDIRSFFFPCIESTGNGFVRDGGLKFRPIFKSRWGPFKNEILNARTNVLQLFDAALPHPL